MIASREGSPLHVEKQNSSSSISTTSNHEDWQIVTRQEHRRHRQLFSENAKGFAQACKDSSKTFLLSNDTIDWFAEKNLCTPKRCEPCLPPASPTPAKVIQDTKDLTTRTWQSQHIANTSYTVRDQQQQDHDHKSSSKATSVGESLDADCEHYTDPPDTVQDGQQHEPIYESPSKTSSVNDSQHEATEHSVDTFDEFEERQQHACDPVSKYEDNSPNTSHDVEDQGSDQESFYDDSSQALNDSEEQHSAARDSNEDDVPSLQSNSTTESDITIPTTADFQKK